MVEAVSLDCGNPVSPSGARLLRPADLRSLLPDDSGLAPLSLPAECLRGREGGSAPVPAPDAVRRFNAAMAAPASPSASAASSAAHPLSPADLPSLLPDDSGLAPLSLPAACRRGAEGGANPAPSPDAVRRFPAAKAEPASPSASAASSAAHPLSPADLPSLLPDDSGLAPLSLPAECLRGREGGSAPVPAPDSVRRFPAAKAEPASPSASAASSAAHPLSPADLPSLLPDDSGLAPLSLPAACRRGAEGGANLDPSPDAVRRFPAAKAEPAAPSASAASSAAHPLSPADLPSLLPDDSGLAPLSLPPELLRGGEGRSPVSAASASSIPAAAASAIAAPEPIVPVDPPEVDALAPTRFFDAGNGLRLPYREYVPQAPAPVSGEEPERVRYPLVLFLHGAGTRGADGSAFSGNVVLRSLLARASRIEPAIVLAPQCPEGEQWVDTPWGETAHVFRETPSRPLSAALELLDREVESLPVDRSRILVCGKSMGGYGTWDLLSRRPDFFAAAVPVCGGGTPGKIAEASRATPVWTVHGDADGTVPVENTRAIAAAVRADPAHAAEFRYREMPGVGHDSWTATFTDPAVMDWFFAQRRTDVEASVATALSAVRQPAPLADAAVAAPAPSSASAAASARTAAVAETVDAVARAVAAEIAATPAIVRGEGRVVIRLDREVLAGTEISLSSENGKLSVEIVPATPQAAETIREALPDLETALAGHVSGFRSFSVALKKEERKDETA